MLRRWTSPRHALPVLASVLVAGCSAILSIPESIDYGPVAAPRDGGPGVGARDGEAVEAGPPIAAARGPKCDGLAPMCGVQADQDCCGSSVVEGGEFSRLYDVAGGPFVDPTFVATVSSFKLDTYEVTVGRFRPFVVAYPASLPKPGDGKNPGDPTDPGWNAAWNAAMRRPTSDCESVATWTQTPTVDDNLPINCVSWFEAFAFCIWDGGRLPTEAEWNYAAVGGSEQRAYPWSVPPTDLTLDRMRAVYRALEPVHVGSAPAGRGRFGQLDLAGNVAEWIVDCSDGPSPLLMPCHDCAIRSANAVLCGIRGGSWSDEGSSVALRGSNRFGLDPQRRVSGLGFRCARPL
jgi:formylglycine-generating enzyme required for sulfatase activity